MKRIALVTCLMTIGFGAAWVSAQTTQPAPGAKSDVPARQRGRGAGPMGQGMMMGGGMGGGMMCPMMLGPDTRMEVKNLPKGVSITLTNEDADAVARLQKMAEASRLMHEAMKP